MVKFQESGLNIRQPWKEYGIICSLLSKQHKFALSGVFFDFSLRRFKEIPAFFFKRSGAWLMMS
jgi:hypothetical protein